MSRIDQTQHHSPASRATEFQGDRAMIATGDNVAEFAGGAFQTNISRTWVSSKELGTTKLIHETKSSKVAGRVLHKSAPVAKHIRTPRYS